MPLTDMSNPKSEKELLYLLKNEVSNFYTEMSSAIVFILVLLSWILGCCLTITIILIMK